MAYLVAPNGDRITATVETVIVTYDILDVSLDDDGERKFALEFYDDGGTVHWDSAEQQTAQSIRGKRECVFQTANGDEYMEGDLTLVEDKAEAA